MAAVFERLRKLGPALAGLAVLALVSLLQFADPAPLERVRMQVFDAFQKAAPRESAGGNASGQIDNLVAVVDIDEESIERLGQWPWPRTELAELNRRLAQAGAASVAYDVVFSEPDRTSPSQIAARYQAMGRGDELSEEFAALPSHDSLFAESFAQVPVVAGFFLESGERGRDIEPKAGFTLHGTMPRRHVKAYGGALLPLPEFETASAGAGSLSLESDADGIVRRVPLVAIHRETLVPGLSLEAVRVARSAGSPNLLTSDGSGENSSAPGSAVAVRIDGMEIPVNDAGEMWVHYPATGAREMLPAWQIIIGTMDDATLAQAVGGKIVFIGGSATGLQDMVSTPVSERIAGVTVHAAAAEQIMSGHFLERPDWAIGLERVLVLLLGGLLALLLPRLGAAKGALAALAGVGLAAGGSWLGFTRVNYLLDPTYIILAIAVIYAVQTVVAFYREEKQRSYIHAAFDRYLSPEIVRQIASDPGALELGGEEKDMSVMMCDIRGFSRISERYSPREVIGFLIGFLTPMSNILLERRATLDKYIGDAILAFWNAPLDDPDHHHNAARAALDMIAKTEALNRQNSSRSGGLVEGPEGEEMVWPGDVKIGIGLNSGLCCVGNMGSRQRLSYSLIGDTVNVAARLEGLTKQYGVPIALGGALAAQLEGSFATIELDQVRVVGRDAPAIIHALLGDEEVLARESFVRLAAAHKAMLTAYRAQNWERAEAALIDGFPEYDVFGIVGLHALFMSRISALRDAQLPPEWDGVFQATKK